MIKRCPAMAPLLLASLAVVVSSGIFAQSAADYPRKPIRVIVPFSPGGGSDVIARLVGARLAERLGQTVVVDNRPAASGIVGTDLVAKASPDGYTLLLVSASHAVSAKLSSKLFVAQGNDVIANTPAEFAQVIAAAAEKWGTLGKRLGVRLD